MSKRTAAAPDCLWGRDPLPSGPCTVLVPAARASFRLEQLPAAAPAALREAARVRAERLFPALGPAVVEAVFGPVGAAGRAAWFAALPRPLLAEIEAAAAAAGAELKAVRIAEFQGAIPAGGVVVCADQATWVAATDGWPSQVVPLGARSGHEGVLARARLQSGTEAPGAAQHLRPELAGLDFLHPALTAPVPLWARPKVRLAGLAAAVALSAAVGLWLWTDGVRRHRADLEAELDALAAPAKAAETQKQETRHLSGWFEGRPHPADDLQVLTQALGDAREPLRLVRVRQAAGEPTVAEGVAGDRATLMAFLTRLRAAAPQTELRSSRLGTGDQVSFEVAFAAPAAGAKPAAKPAAKQETAPAAAAAPAVESAPAPASAPETAPAVRTGGAQ